MEGATTSGAIVLSWDHLVEAKPFNLAPTNVMSYRDHDDGADDPEEDFMSGDSGGDGGGGRHAVFNSVQNLLHAHCRQLLYAWSRRAREDPQLKDM